MITPSDFIANLAVEQTVDSMKATATSVFTVQYLIAWKKPSNGLLLNYARSY